MQNYDPYASHLQVLRKLGAGVRHVLELGSGTYSTRLFLDQAAFPALLQLCVVEPDEAWAAKLPADPRLMRWPESHDYGLSHNYFDLILIDSGPEERRIRDIETIAGFRMKTCVVIHDFEHVPYQHAALPFTHVEIDRVLTPWTAMCWND